MIYISSYCVIVRVSVVLKRTVVGDWWFRQPEWKSSSDSEDDFRPGCRNVSHQQQNLQENFLAIFVSDEAEEAKIWWNQHVQRRTKFLAPDLSDCGSHCFKLRRMIEGTRGDKSRQWSRTGVKMQQVPVPQNCWRTDAIPKFQQQEIESSRDVGDIDLKISSFWLHETYGFRKCLENEEV